MGVVCKRVVENVVSVKDMVKRLGVESKQYRPKYGPLGDSALKPDGVRVQFVDGNSLVAVGEVGREPRKSSAMDAKSVLKTFKEDVVVNSVKGC